MKRSPKYTGYLLFSIVFLGIMAAYGLDNTLSSRPSLPQNSALPVTITPTCLDRSEIPFSEYHWLYMPSSPSELNTREYYGFLGGQLIINGVVDASDCPLNGLWPTGYANACGLEKGLDIIVELQNMYDDEILQVGMQVGVPPVMLKQLIRYESQFWPARYGIYHFGLSHLTLIGASNAIQWSPEIYNDLCQEVYNGPCPGFYYQSFPGYDNILSGQLLSMLDANCPTCEYSIDLVKAQNSIYYIGQSLMSYCRQTSQIVYNVTNQHSSFSVDYATIWKLTLLNYNAGPKCVHEALKATYDDTNTSMSWSRISGNVPEGACEEGVRYVNNITAPYYTFTP